MYIPQQGLQNKGRAWRNGMGTEKLSCLQTDLYKSGNVKEGKNLEDGKRKKNNFPYNQISVNLVVATGLVAASAYTVLFPQQW